MGSGKLDILSLPKTLALFCLLMIHSAILLAQAPDLKQPLPTPQAAPATGDRRAKVVCPTPEETKQRYRPLSEIEVKLAPSAGATPIDCSVKLFAPATEGVAASQMSLSWGQIEYQWTPTELAHQPLYFDDAPLERYGQTVSPALQPILSGARFFGTLPVVPYKIGLNGPWDRVTTLGYYRPGSPAPCVSQTLPLKFDAAFIESGAWVGLIFLLP